MTREQIEAAMIKKGFAYFSDGELNLNIIGVRQSSTGNKVTNLFDDFWRFFEKRHFYVKYAVLLFSNFGEKFGYFLF